MTVGANIRKQRNRAGLTRKILAERLGVASITLYRWETGRRVLSTDDLLRVADALEVPASALVDGCVAKR